MKAKNYFKNYLYIDWWKNLFSYFFRFKNIFYVSLSWFLMMVIGNLLLEGWKYQIYNFGISFVSGLIITYLLYNKGYGKDKINYRFIM